MAVVLILAFFTVELVLVNAHGIGLIGGLGGLGADLNIGLGSHQSSGDNNRGGYKHGFEGGIGGSSSVSIASASTVSSHGGFGGDGSGVLGGYASSDSNAFGHTNSRAESSGLGLKLGLGIDSGAGNILGHHIGGLGLLDVGVGIVGSAESSSSSATGSASASGAYKIHSENHHAGTPILIGSSSSVETSGAAHKGGYSTSSLLKGSSASDIAKNLALDIESDHRASASAAGERVIESNYKNDHDASRSSHMSAAGRSSHRLIKNSYAHGISSSESNGAGLLGIIPSSNDSERKNGHSFKHSSRGSSSLKSSLNAGIGNAGSLVSAENGSRDTLGRTYHGTRNIITAGGHNSGHTGSHAMGYTTSSSWSKENSFSKSHSAAHSQFETSSGSTSSTLSNAGRSHDSDVVANVGGSKKTSYGHAINIGGTSSVKVAADSILGTSDGAALNSDFKISKHESDHSSDRSFSDVGFSENLSGSKVISGSSGGDDVHKIISSGSYSSSSGSRNSNSGNIRSKGVFTSGLKVESSSQNVGSLAAASSSSAVSHEVSNSQRTTNSKTAIEKNASANTGTRGMGSVSHSLLSRDSAGAAHSSEAGANFGLGVGLDLLGSKSLELITSPGGSLSSSSGGSTSATVKINSPAIVTSSLTSRNLHSGRVKTEKNIGAGIGVGLSVPSPSLLSDTSLSYGSMSENSAGLAVHGSHLPSFQIISSASADGSSIISDSTSSNTADISGYYDGINSSSERGIYGAELSTGYSAASRGSQSLGSRGILGHIDGLIGGIHKSVHASTGLLDTHASVGSYSSSGASSQALAGYSSDHRASYRDNFKSDISAPASSSSLLSISGDLGFGLGR